LEKRLTHRHFNILEKWILENHENPYPSRQVKKRLSLEANLSVEDVTKWFEKERKKIKRSKKNKSQRILKKNKDISNNFYNHVDKYTNRIQMEILSEQTGLSVKKIIKWFSTKHQILDFNTCV
jgi:hypothetical protein